MCIGSGMRIEDAVHKSFDSLTQFNTQRMNWNYFSFILKPLHLQNSFVKEKKCLDNQYITTNAPIEEVYFQFVSVHQKVTLYFLFSYLCWAKIRNWANSAFQISLGMKLQILNFHQNLTLKTKQLAECTYSHIFQFN